jgi:hypothetical protein
VIVAICAPTATVAPFGGHDRFQDAAERRGHLGIDLVGRDFHQRLILLDPLARLLQPAPDRPLRDTLPEVRHRDLGHRFPQS